MGEYGVGHYYSYVRPDIRKDKRLYRFNDDIVEKVSLHRMYLTPPMEGELVQQRQNTLVAASLVD
jgi:hypothetical protein